MNVRFSALALAFAILLSAVCVAAQQPPRDEPRATPSVTATIAGVVVSDESSPRPLRRARVMLGGPALPLGRTLITQDDGTFAFEGLPAGRYTLSAAKEGYVPMGYGATRPGRRGSSIIADGGAAVRLTVKLPRGSVITGTVTTLDGQPAAGLAVSALMNRYDPQAGERRLSAVTIAPTQTDDRGVYRIYGLAAGEYAVAAYVRNTPGMTGEVQALSHADVQRALAGVSAPPRRTLTPAPVFFTGTAVASQATMVTLGKGEERTGVDIQFDYAPTAVIEGTVVSPRPDGIDVSLSSHATMQTPGIPTGFSTQRRVDADGRFSIAGVPPGQYSLLASSWIPPASSDASPAILSASTDLAINGEDISGLVLTVTPGIRLAGRIVFDGAEPLAADLASLTVNVPLTPAASTGVQISIPPLHIDSGGRFVLNGLAPGTYRVGANAQGLHTPIGKWWLTSILIEGREALDSTVDLRRSIDGTIVTFSDRASALSGIVRDDRGEPVADAWLVVFSTHSGAWFPNSRRIAAVRTGANGSYSIRNLPAGEYHLATTLDLQQGEWFDAVLLQQLASVATRITITDREHKTIDPVLR
jgi:hypothetical protein